MRIVRVADTMGDVIRFPDDRHVAARDDDGPDKRQTARELARARPRFSKTPRVSTSCPRTGEVDEEGQAELEARRIRFGYDSWIWRPSPDDDGSAA